MTGAADSPGASGTPAGQTRGMEPDTGTRVVQTHVSRLFFVDDRVVKVKLAVHN